VLWERAFVSYADITSGDFVMTTVPLDRGFASLLSCLSRCGGRFSWWADYFLHRIPGGGDVGAPWSPSFDGCTTEAGVQALAPKSGRPTEGIGFEENDPSLLSGARCFIWRHARQAWKITGYGSVPRQYLVIDESHEELEICANQQDGSSRFTLFLHRPDGDSGGARMLKNWISFRWYGNRTYLNDSSGPGLDHNDEVMRCAPF
jgi:hypothetical protein